MRCRLMRSMVSAVFVVTVLLGVPFAILDAKFDTRSAQDMLNQEVQRIGILTDVQLTLAGRAFREVLAG